VSQANPPERRGAGMGGTLMLAAWQAFAAGAAAPAVAQDSRAPLELATFPRTSLEITRHEKHHAARRYAFEVWVADTPERAEQGLMFVSDLPDTMGMVFPLPTARVATMWMRNNS